MIDVWSRCGLKEYRSPKEPGHYVIGRPAPPEWKTRPFAPPRDSSNVITFHNGRCIEMLSFDLRSNNLGGSYDTGSIDEAVLIDFDRHNKDIVPMIRGNTHRYKKGMAYNYHQQMNYVSTMAWLQKGMWVPDMKDRVNPSDPNDIFYIESTTHDNKHVLGDKYLKQLEADLPYWVYQVEIMNRRITKLPNGFYDQLNEDIHLYHDSYHYGHDENGALITTGDRDYRADTPLELSFDFGSKITCCTVHQAHQIGSKLVEHVINSFYRKRDLSTTGVTDSLMTGVVNDVITKYRGHKAQLVIWGDRNGNNMRADSNMTYYQEIQNAFRKEGFNVVLKVKGTDAFHQVKHFTMNQLLSETDPALPIIRFNQNTTKHVIISMQNAPVTADFKKDKSSERQNIDQLNATHLSDCIDNYFHHKYGHLFGRSSSAPTSPIFI